MITLLIADDHNLLRHGLRSLLESHFSSINVIEAINGRELISKAREHHPDIIFADYRMPELNGFNAAEILLKENPRYKIILLTIYESFEIAANFVKIGGAGFMTKKCQCQDIFDAINTVMRGDYYFEASLEPKLNKWISQGLSQRLPSIKFTQLELDIIVKLVRGLTSQEIADALSLSKRTVDTYRFDMMQKAGVDNVAELVAFIYRNGLHDSVAS